MGDDLAAEINGDRFRRLLATMVVGAEIRHVVRTGSTNEDLKLLARAGAPEGLVVCTDEQTQGRGRRGRAWTAPPSSSLLCSTLLRPSRLAPGQGFYLTMLAAVACAEAIEETVGLPVDLKWPNDLQLSGRKLGGILVETEIAQGHLVWAVVGIGLNVNWDAATIPELAASATTLASAAGRPISRAELLRSLLQRLENHYLRLRAGQRQPLFEEWHRRLTTVGQNVRVEVAGAVLEGFAEGVAPDGALIVRDSVGTCHELTGGEVTVRSG